MASRRLFDGAQIELGLLPIEAPASGTISGSSSLTFASSGTLTGSAASDIAGSSSLSFASSGTLAANVQVAGSSSITFALSGTLTGAAASDIAGSSSLTFTPSGALAARVNIFGATALVFTGTATADQPIPPEPPFIRPSRNGGGSMYVLPSETAADKLRLREDQELVEIVSILATMGVFHGNR
jgi:spore coat protein U-like protein